MFQSFGLMSLLWVVSVVSVLFMMRFVKRHEVPRLTLQLSMLAPGLISLAAALLLDLETRWWFLVVGVGGMAVGLVGLGALLWATRLTGLQPRSTPLDVSPTRSGGDL